ncbi:nicotinate-nucleotide--dimethylbenzimidazole phosphoribosyltransferase [Actinophytocola algeriensis]|uniref:Nicotinate-nucleotide--dimethylbenzimidazole phosphoribosyltransferase n=1 Tax=Actinophytocola algeriensis TaxID=1768010 RepID=A0A7W7VC43_9PSEU|nr:nicotinate-nucleotide--dimethylbenzimidazole phosphoribosyltransferase [Actinophytocola algeriensis]MBE1476373.1 nicotinate-nucleotide--dimethylbenzimidazole phosphoribosyltransferase [Actinophytocola algeriensis]
MEFDVVSPPDESVRQAAEERHAQLTKPLGALGLLEELGTWIAACQGQCPPRPLQRPRVIVFAGDHGVAAKGVSAYPSEVTAQMVANFQSGGAAINVLAGIASATVRVVDMSVAVDTTAGDHKVRRSSGAIDTEDALTEDEVQAALAAGRAIADEEVDSGADLLVAGDMGIGNTTPAAVLVAALTGTEPVAVVGRGTGIDDNTWMRKTAAIRDALRRAKPVTADPVALLRTVAGADITAMAAFLAQAAVRRTPVVLDGVVSGAAALLAEELAPGARAWWVAGHRSTEPAHTLVLEQLDMTPLLELNMRLGEGSGATTAIPLLTMAVQVLTDMATFADAGVSGPATEAAATETVAPEEAEPETAEAGTTAEDTAESGAEAAERRAEEAERRAEAAERRAQEAERRAEAAEDRAPATEPAGTTAEDGAPAAARGTRSTEPGADATPPSSS